MRVTLNSRNIAGRRTVVRKFTQSIVLAVFAGAVMQCRPAHDSQVYPLSLETTSWQRFFYKEATTPAGVRSFGFHLTSFRLAVADSEEAGRAAAQQMRDQGGIVHPDLFLTRTQEENGEIQATRDYQHAAVSSTAAWSVTKGQGASVAVVDTGVQSEHGELKQAVSYCYSAFTGAGTCEIKGDHATHVAGIIAARLNTVGMAGIAPESQILSITALSDIDGENRMSTILAAMDHAAEIGGPLIMNASFGGYSRGPYAPLQDVIEELNRRGVLLVAASGNDRVPLRDDVWFVPASFSRTLPNVIAVNASDSAGHAAVFTNIEAANSVFAPGVEIYSTVPNGFELMSGTSMAAPVVSGVAALVLSRYPTLEPFEVRRAIMESCAGEPCVVNAQRALVIAGGLR